MSTKREYLTDIKKTEVELPAPRRSVQREHRVVDPVASPAESARRPSELEQSAASSNHAVHGYADLVEAARNDGPVQRAAPSSAAEQEEAPARIHEAAERGITGPGQPLPHRAAIEKSFGGHDVSSIVAHTDATAATSARAMGATAFTTGHHIAFDGEPTLRTAAHEAAHVIQQRGGVQLQSGIGQKEDVHEKHADAVAEQVAAGQSAEALLNQYQESHSDGKTRGIQREEGDAATKKAGSAGEVAVTDATEYVVSDSNAIVRNGPPNFKAAEPKSKVARGTFVKIIARSTDGVYAKIKAPGGAAAAELGWTSRGNLSVKLDVSQFKTKGTISEVSWGETSGLYPANRAEYDPTLWDGNLTQVLLAARRAVHTLGERGQSVHRATPDLSQPIEKTLSTYHLIENFPPVDSEISDAGVKWFYLSKNPSQPRHPGLSQSHERVKSYGPFFNNGGGDVARGAGVYLHFFKLKGKA